MNIKKFLKERNIKFKTHKHPAVYTCEQVERLIKCSSWLHCKNLFLKNKKSNRFYLIVMPAKKTLNFKELEKKLNDKLKFADKKELKTILNLIPGSVSPFSVINDIKTQVVLLNDKEVYESETLGFHPNINTETLELTKYNFHKFLNSINNKIEILK